MAVSFRSVGKTRVLWLTNIATPYRIPAWQAVATQVDLTMALLSNTEKNRWWNLGNEEISIPVQFLDVKAIRYGERSLYLPSKSLRRLLAQDFDVFILGGWESPAYLYALRVAKKRGIKTISHYGSTDKSHSHSKGLINRMRTWFYRSLDSHVTYGTDASESLVNMGIHESKIYTGFNSVDHEYFYQKSQLYQRLETADSGHKYIYSGQLIERKNVTNLIQAFNKIHRPGDTLTLAGSGDFQPKLEELVTELGLLNAVHFIGHISQDELIMEYCSANTLVLPSFNEVWGLVVNEALACGLNVVVSERCGITSDIKHMNGVYISQCDVESISEKMAESRVNWTGYQKEPEILQYGIGRYAQQFIHAIQVTG